MTRRLVDLAPGAEVRLAPPSAGGTIPRRLLDLGFVPGTALRIVRRAPFGDPIEIELRGYRICLRNADLAMLEVECVDAP